MTYEQYLNYLDTLEGVARIPYTKSLEDPPSTMFGYRRPFTEKELDEYVKACDRLSKQAAEMGMVFTIGL